MTEPFSAAAVARRSSLSDQAIDFVRREIAAGRYRPGDRLPTEASLARVLGVSRSVVREAIARLRQEGILRTRQGVGAFLCEPSAPRSLRLDALDGLSVTSALELRIAIEVEAASLAAQRCDFHDVLAMRGALNERAREVACGGPGLDPDQRFHRLILIGSRNPLLVEVGCFALPMTVQALQSAAPVPPLAEAADIDSEHEAIFVAIAAREAEAARIAMRRHLEQTRRRIGL